MYKELIAQFPQPAVLVIGDLMLDVYLKGASTRLTPEAPVPVVDIETRTTVLGGGANTAINVKYLGAQVSFCSVSGQDEEGVKARTLLDVAGINSRIITCPQRSTIVKTRVTAGHQLLTRYDSGTETAIDRDTEEAFIRLLQQEFVRHDAIIIADYNKGLLTPAVVAALRTLNLQQKKFIAVDSKRLECFKSLSPSLVKPNYQEAVNLLGLPVQAHCRAQQINNMGADIATRTGAAVTAVTLDEEGAVIFDGQEPVYCCGAHPVISPNVSGAGDAYISAFTLASLAGADLAAAAELAATAAGVAISKQETAYCSWQELNASLSVNDKYITDLAQLQHISNMYKAQGKKLVFTNGCFDILHSGHVNYLGRARQLGHILMVGINTDESIRRLKGNDRPINSLHDRMEVLAALGAVNHIIPFGSEQDDTPAPLIAAIQPHIFAKGGDYTKDALPEAGLVEQLGGEVILLPLLPGRSTSMIIRRIHTTPVLKLA
ncbi:PfkB family carbohydrate kinase [Chitinophaga agrisoli]|nr:PfkB family carbohydrate kinase [Chitinophaga agrisoli]